MCQLCNDNVHVGAGQGSLSSVNWGLPTTSHPDSRTPDKVEATIYPPPVPLLSTTTLPLFSTFVTGTIFNFIIHFAVLYEFGMEMGSLLLQFGEYFVKSIFPRCHVSQLTNWKGNDRKKIIKSFLLLLYQLGVNQVCHIWRVDTGHWSGEVSSWHHVIMSSCHCVRIC